MPSEQIKLQIANTFGNASSSYDDSARLQRYSGELLLSKLPKNTDSVVLDLGSGTGYFAEVLATKFNTVIGLDLSKEMLNFSKLNRNKNINWLNADMHNIPLADNSVDIVFSNLAIQWCNPLTDAFIEIKRILKPDGVLIFSSLLDGTLTELKQSWLSVDNDDHVIDFNELIDIENSLQISGLSITKLEKKPVVLDYDNVRHLAKELKNLGASKVPNRARKGLSGKNRWKKMTQAYDGYLTKQGVYPATYQLCTGMVMNTHE
ncbi:malonyl-ACP O-methyltransferase BioC [Thalassotalea psychrophila]|uniref:Malonyl-[acyl-carrier protein] O-methyltransferase n=1 Tax=Thalassotalea psychrophila TaxID=3065647 RepID=A0ABY9TQ13_9GAMM|nr:malonyl-ACP O-methyltransferase BioC [Colwelliaceae bacterium SQ149]